MLLKITVESERYPDIVEFLDENVKNCFVMIKTAPKIDPSHPGNITLTLEFQEQSLFDSSQKRSEGGLVYREVALIPFLEAAGLFPPRPNPYVPPPVIVVTEGNPIVVTTPNGESTRTCLNVSLRDGKLALTGGGSLIGEIKGHGMQEVCEQALRKGSKS